MVFNKEYILEKIEKGVFVVMDIGKNFIQTKEEKTQKEYLANAKKLISLAKEAGADAVKFQTHNTEDEQSNINIISPHFSGSDRYNWIKRNESITPLSFWKEIKEYSQKKKIIFFSTPMSRGAAIKLEKVGVPLWKVSSGDILDFVMLDFIAATKKPIILSSGMSTLAEVDKAVDFLKKRNCKIALLHCVSKYPCPKEELNLKTIAFLKKRYNIPIGFSDHSIGYEHALAAVNMGGTIIEKHFSLNRNLWGPDHKASMTPQELIKMTENIKNKKVVDAVDYGKEIKVLQKGERDFRPIFRKSLVASQNIEKGKKITKEMIYAIRPQKYIGGLPSEKYEEVVGRRLNQSVKKYEPIKKDYLAEPKL